MGALKDLARSNYIAAAIRNLLGEVTEVYVKWWYGGAFNGAAWVSPATSADVFFYRSRPGGRSDGLEVQFSRGTAVAHGVPLRQEALSDAIAQADRAFDAALSSSGETILNIVRRLQLWVWMESSQALAATELSLLQKRLEVVLPGTVSATNVAPMPGPTEQWQADIDVTLFREQRHDDLIRCLVPLFPQVSGSMFGAGTTWSLEEDRAETQIIKGVQLTARQA